MTRKARGALRRELQDKAAFRRCALQFGMLGDRTQMKICWLLCKHRELSVGEIAGVLSVSVSGVSRILRKLRRYRVVAGRRAHRQVLYPVTNTSLGRLVQKEVGAQ